MRRPALSTQHPLLLCNIHNLKMPVVCARHNAIIVAVHSRCDASKALQ